ncbi:MAG: oligosaccharide flippase family protein [Candidatus Margulisiibacteriota bacterium]
MERGPKRQSLLDHLKLKLSHKRTKKAFIGSVSIVLSKFLALTLGLITTAILVRYVSAEEFGLWGSLTFLIGMIPVLDFGLALALRNKLSMLYSKSETHANNSRRYFFSAFSAYMYLAGLLIILLCLCYKLVPWAKLFNTYDAGIIHDGSLTYTVSLVIIVISMPFAVSTQGFFSFQQTHWNSFFELCKSIFILLFFGFLVMAKAGFVLIACSFAVAMMSPVIVSFFVFLKERRWRFEWAKAESIIQTLKELLPQSIQFGIMQFCATFIFSSQAIMVGKLISLKEAGEYVLVQKLFLILTVVHFAVLTPLWSAYTDAVASNDIRWVKKTLAYSAWFSVILFAFGAAFLYLFGKPIIHIWTGKSIQNNLLYLCMGIWVFLTGWVSCFSVYLNGIGKLRLQTAWLVFSAASYIPFTLHFGERFGAVGVCLAGIIVLLPLVISNPIEAVLSLKHLERFKNNVVIAASTPL